MKDWIVVITPYILLIVMLGGMYYWNEYNKAHQQCTTTFNLLNFK